MNASLCTFDSNMLLARGSQILREMSSMQVHSRLQQIVLEKYNPRKMRVLEPSIMQHKKSLKDIEVLVDEDGDGRHAVKFNLQQVWMLQSPSTYRDAYGFRRALMGDNYNSPSSELSVSKYPSLVFVTYNKDIGCASDKEVVKCKPFMDAEDVVKFLLSDFARRGSYDDIFEDDDLWEMPKVNGDQKREQENSDDREFGCGLAHLAAKEPESRQPDKLINAGKSGWKGPPELVKILEQSYADPAFKHVTAQSTFVQNCLTKIVFLQRCFSERASIASEECGVSRKKRKLDLANIAAQNIANILLDANTMLYFEAMDSNA